MKTGPLFPKLLACPKKIIVLQGGGDSLKTTSALQYIAVQSTQYKRLFSTVTGQDMPNLKGGALQTFENYVASEPEISRYIQRYNASDHFYLFKNGSKVQFKAFENEQDARGSERAILFMNEANSQTYKMFWQLQRKTRRKVIIDYNPNSRFWVHNQVLPGPTQDKQFAGKVQLYITDHRHNPFLTQEEHDNYENIGDPELFRVYSRGMTGKITGLIFGHFKMLPDDEWPSVVDRIIWGVDYGYTSDPTAIVKIAVVGRKRYWKEIYYETGANADVLDAVIRTNGWQEGQDIYSEADPNMVNQLRVKRLPVIPAIKGPGSLAAGISKVRQFETYYTSDSRNLEKELSNYKFVTAQDIVTGKEVTTNVPMDGWDHLCNAGMYATYTDSFRHRIS